MMTMMIMKMIAMMVMKIIDIKEYNGEDNKTKVICANSKWDNGPIYESGWPAGPGWKIDVESFSRKNRQNSMFCALCIVGEVVWA